MTKEEQREYRRKYWSDRKEHPEIRERNKYVTELRQKHKEFKFEYDGKIISIEVMLPFRIMKERGKNKDIDTKAYAILQQQLRRKVNEIEHKQNLVIIEPSYIQCYIQDKEKVEPIIQMLIEFVKEQVKTYGKYKKIGKNIGSSFD